MGPSIEMAEKGFAVSRNMAGTLKDVGTERFTPYKASRNYFLHKDGSLYQEGEIFVQKDLGKVLRRIADDPRDFYTGKTAKLIVKDMKKMAASLQPLIWPNINRSGGSQVRPRIGDTRSFPWPHPLPAGPLSRKS